MESWLLYEYSMLSVRTAESIYEALRFDGVLSFRFRFLKVVIFLGWVWIVPVPGAGGRGLMIQGRRYHHLLGLEGGIISCLGLGLGIISWTWTWYYRTDPHTWFQSPSHNRVTASSSIWSHLLGRDFNIEIEIILLQKTINFMDFLALYLCCMTAFGFLFYFATGADT